RPRSPRIHRPAQFHVRPGIRAVRDPHEEWLESDRRFGRANGRYGSRARFQRRRDALAAKSDRTATPHDHLHHAGGTGARLDAPGIPRFAGIPAKLEVTVLARMAWGAPATSGRRSEPPIERNPWAIMDGALRSSTCTELNLFGFGFRYSDLSLAQISTGKRLSRGSGHHVVAGALPGAHSAIQDLDVCETFALVFFCPTGSCGVARSGSVEDDLTVPEHRAELAAKLVHRERAFK